YMITTYFVPWAECEETTAMFVSRGARWASIVMLMVLLAGCAGTRTVDHQSATAMLASSDYQAYAAQDLDGKGQPKYDPSSLLDTQEDGKAFNDAGMWALSSDGFDAASKLLSWEEDTVHNPEEVANLIGTTLPSDACGAYQGNSHRRSLIGYYHAIIHR